MSMEFIYKECLHWISQIQCIRNELDRVKTQLKESVNLPEARKEKAILSESINGLSSNLDNAEAILLASLNNGTIYWAGHSQTYDTPKISPCENDIFDRMKIIYSEYVELQRSMVQFIFKMDNISCNTGIQVPENAIRKN